MTTALATTPATLSVNEMMNIGELFAQSGLFADIRGAAQATTKIIAGQELGIPPFAAMNGFHIIKGKAAMGANLIGATIKRSGKYDYIVREMSPERCEIEFFQLIDGKRQSIGKSEFTIADAKKAGTQNLDRFPRNMLFARAMSNGARWYTPDVFLGPIYTPEELGAQVDEAGDVISTASFASPVQAAPELPPPPPLADDLGPLADAVKRLRETERQVATEPPPFVWNKKQGRAALEAEREASRARLAAWLEGKHDVDLTLLNDAELMDVAYSAEGL